MKNAVCIVAFVALLSACEDPIVTEYRAELTAGASSHAPDATGEGRALPEEQYVEVFARDMQPAAEGHYEAWFRRGGEEISFGTFGCSTDNWCIQSAHDIEGDVTTIESFFITLEPDDDDDPAPSDARCLEGSLEEIVLEE